MDYSIKRVGDGRIVLFKFSGDMSTKDGFDAFLEYVSRPDFDQTATMVTDARGITALDTSFKEMLVASYRLSKELGKFDQRVESIILVGNSEVFAMARMLQSLLESMSNIGIQVVESETEALKLLRIKHEYIENFFDAT